MPVDEDEVTQMVQHVQELRIRLQDLLVPGSCFTVRYSTVYLYETEYQIEVPQNGIFDYRLVADKSARWLIKSKLIAPKLKFMTIAMYGLTPLGYAVAQTLQLIADMELTEHVC